jgi:TonB family protein
MNYGATNAGTQYEDLNLRKFFFYSLALHAGLTTIFFVGSFLQTRGNPWGGVGGGQSGVKVSLVSSAGIPMPKPTNPTESQVVDPTKGIYKEEPPKPPEPKKDATPLPKFDKEKPLPVTHPSKTFESKTPPPENAVPYGKGGNPNLPTGYSTTPGDAAGGVAVQGAGGGDFSSRYGWYIESVKRRINSNWLQNTIDPTVRAARHAHCVVTFTITRDGTVRGISLTQTSGNLSMDNSAQRALLSSSPMPPLPPDYSGSYVNVIFDFDLAMTK